MRSKHPVERKSHARVASQRDTAPPTCHQTRLVPRARGMPVQFQCRARILDRVVCLRVDVLSEDDPGRETERETALAIT